MEVSLIVVGADIFAAVVEPDSAQSGLARALAEASVVVCSACLLGFTCRYDAQEKGQARVWAALVGKAVVPVCPEEAGGLGTPRPAADLTGGDGAAVLDGTARVFTETGRDVTEEFLAGAEHAVEAARAHGATVAILKARSPSCGTRTVWIDRELRDGHGVAAARLARAGLTVLSDEDLEPLRDP